MSVSSIQPPNYDSVPKTRSHPQNSNSGTFDQLSGRSGSGVDKTTISVEARKILASELGSNPQNKTNGVHDGKAWTLERLQVDNPSYLAEKIPGAGSNMTLNINNPQTHTYY